MDLLPWAYQGFGLAVAETMEGRWGEYRERAQVEVLVRGARGHMMPGVLMQIAVMLALGSGVVRAVGPAAAGLEAGVPEVQAHGNDEAGLKPRYVAVVGFKTLSSGGDDESWMGVGLGEELATRLSMAGNAIKTIERLQLSEILAPCAVLPGVPPAQTVPHMVIGDENPELDKACAAALRQAKTSGTLYSADALIVGTLLCDGQFLSATTRLVDVETGAVQWGVTARVPGSRGSVEAVRSLAATLTESWCGKLNVPVLSEMRDVGVEKASVYQALWQARQSLYDGRYEQCLETIAWAEAQTPGLEQLEGLMATRDEAWSLQLERVGPDELQVQAIITQMLQSAQHTKDYYKQGYAMSCYYMGRAYEKAGRLAQAEVEYRECLEQRPGHLLWDFEAGCAIGPLLIVESIAYAASEDGHIRAFNARSGQVLWEFHGDVPCYTLQVVDGLVYALGDAHIWVLDTAHGHVAWTVNDASIASGDLCEIEDGVVYVGTPRAIANNAVTAGSLCALDAKTGKQRWAFNAAAGRWSTEVVGDTVYTCSSDGYVRALQAANGTLRWETRLTEDTEKSIRIIDAQATSPLVYASVYTPLPSSAFWDAPRAHLNRRLCVLDPRSGRVLWRTDTGVWPEADPVLDGGRVYLGGVDSYLRAIDAGSGKTAWTFEASGTVGTPAIRNGIVYAASDDGRLQALREDSGVLLWDVMQLGQTPPAFSVGDGVVYTTSDAGILQALRASDGKPLWKTTTGAGHEWVAMTAVEAGTVYVQSTAGLLATFEAGTGRPLGCYDADEPMGVSWLMAGVRIPTSDWVLTDGVVYRSRDSHLRAFRTDIPAGPDYVERATARLMTCIGAAGRVDEAARFAARLYRETEQRSEALQAAYPAVAPQDATAWTVADGLRMVTGEQDRSPAPVPVLWSISIWERISDARVADGTAYVNTDTGHLIAVDVASGQRLWEYQTKQKISRVLVADDVVYCEEEEVENAFSLSVHAFEARTGKQLWKRDHSCRIASIGGGIAIVEGPGGQMQALSPQSGKVCWEYTSQRGLDLRCEAITDHSVLVREICYIASMEPCDLWALDIHTGKASWSSVLSDSLSEIAVANGCIYATDHIADRISVLSEASGELLWVSDVGLKPSGISVSGDTIYVSSAETRWGLEGYHSIPGILACNATDGKCLWGAGTERHDTRCIPTTEGVVCVTRPGSSYLYGLNALNGASLWTLKSSGPYGFNHARVANGLLYAWGWKRYCILDASSGVLLWGTDKNCVISDGIVLVIDGERLHAIDPESLRTRGPQPFTWSTRRQFWSYVIWGKGGLALSKMQGGYPFPEILMHDNWPSADALADEIERLASLRDWSAPANAARGAWYGPKAMAQDPGTLCPPELSVDLKLTHAGIRPAAQHYLMIARFHMGERMIETDRFVALWLADQYVQEALRLHPDWTAALTLRARIRSSGMRRQAPTANMVQPSEGGTSIN